MSKTRSVAVVLVAGFFIGFGATYLGGRAVFSPVNGLGGAIGAACSRKVIE